MGRHIEGLEKRRLLAAAVAEVGGLVVLEAEHFSANISRGGQSWISQASPAGFGGEGAMVTSPNSGVAINSGFATTSPELRFDVSFTTTGTYKVWVRARAPSGNEDSLHVGLDNLAVATSDRMSVATSSSYVWSSKTMDGPASTINITSTGIHTINVWMREDGLILDRIVLSKNGLTPSGVGPAESASADAYIAPSPMAYPDVKFHLTARPWQAVGISRVEYLDKAEGIVRAMAKYQNANGQLIDPYKKIEVQYATPYFANALGTLLSAGRAIDLLPKGIAAMNSATLQVSGGKNAIPQQHGEFFLAPITAGIELYAPLVPQSTIDLWRSRMSKSVSSIITGYTMNWRTYAMKGEWLRAKAGLVNTATAVAWIESSWKTTQLSRLTGNALNLYHDDSSDPDTIAYDAASRGNLYAMLEAGYDGPSANQMRQLVERGNRAGLYLVDPTGQGPDGGRSSDHVWNDVVAGLVFERMAEEAAQKGDLTSAGQYRRAAELAVQSTDRWQKSDGSYSVTKNQFDPALRVGYADYSEVTNYNGYMMFHLAEMYLTRQTDIAEVPTPAEIGGYAFSTDTSFAGVFASAGGMTMQASTRGSTLKVNGRYWTPLGVTRFSRSDWDSRLGPGDGIRDAASGLGASFAPTFLENGKWIRLASVPDRYEGTFSVQFTNPVLVRCAIDYKPKAGKSGPTFRNEFVITPDGILCTATSSSKTFGMTWPVLTNDGTALMTTYTSSIAATSYPGGGDSQNYIALDNGTTLTTNESLVRSAYGDLRPVRSQVTGGTINRTFIFPRNVGDPTAESVRTSFAANGKNFSTVLGRVQGNTYVGQTCAGGFDDGIDLNNDGVRDVTFSEKCSFALQLKNGKVTAIESDRPVASVVQGKSIALLAYSPVEIVWANQTPAAPVIIEPLNENELVSGADVHMETDVFSAPDPTVSHASSDWEIWTAGATPTRVWSALGVTDLESKVHIHLGNGTFEGPLAGQIKLAADTDYELRVRHRSSGDDEFNTSLVSVRHFRTMPEEAPTASGWVVRQEGFKVEELPLVFPAGEPDFMMPVNIAFVPESLHGHHPLDPLFYVNDLYGAIRVVTNNYTVFTYAGNTLNYDPFGPFPGTGENGMTGLVIDPTNGDIYVSMLYDEPNDGTEGKFPKVTRYTSIDGGLHAIDTDSSAVGTQGTDILKMPGEQMLQSHIVSNLTFGPDDKLWLHIGDGFETPTSRDDDRFKGKILHFNRDGTPSDDNPNYDPSNGITALDYWWAKGFRNPFGGAWRDADPSVGREAQHFTVENGNNTDRFSMLVKGRDYLWDGTETSTQNYNIAYSPTGTFENGEQDWSPAVAPVNIAFIQDSAFDGSMFPESKHGHAFVTVSGPTHASGPNGAKSIQEWVLNDGGTRKVFEDGTPNPRELVSYEGAGFSTAVAISAGPDGLYFSTLYADTDPNSTAAGAKILRVVYTGEAHSH